MRRVEMTGSEGSKTVVDLTATTGSITVVDSATSTTTNAANQTVVTGTPTAGSSVTATLVGQDAVVLQISGTHDTILAFERSFDGGTTYTPASMERIGIGDAVTTLTASDNKAYFFRSNASGATNFRVRCTTRNSGTVTVRFQPSWGGTQIPVNQGIPAAVGNAWTFKQTDGTNTAPTGDAVGRAVFQKITDGTLTGGLVDETGSSAVDAQAVGGGTPHDSVNSGNPLYLGAEAIAHGSNPSAVAAADRTKLYANRAGVLFVIGGHPNTTTIRLNFTSAQTNVAIVTVSTGLKIVVTAIQVTVDNSSTVFPQVIIGFATATTPTTTSVVASHPAVPAGGGFNRGDGSGILGVGADNEDLRITTTGTVGGNGCDVVVSYYTIET